MFRLPLLLFLVCVLSVHSHEHSHEHGHSHAHGAEPMHLKYLRNANIKLAHIEYTAKRNMRADSAQQLWLETGTAILLISLAPFLLLCLLPDLAKRQVLLKIFLAFAAGGLLGDAFLHLIPHAIDQHHDEAHGESQRSADASDAHSHRRHLVVGLSIVSGIFLFLCIEKLIRVFQRGGGHGHGHSHHGSSPPQSQTESKHSSPPTPSVTHTESSQKNKKKKKGNGDDAHGKHATQQQPSNKAQAQQSTKKVAKQFSGTELKVAGYLNLAADFTHNFTDGLAIGASFLLSRNAGMVTTLTVLMHELPHEIGDYAILIQSGCSARKAMFLQLSTAIGAAIGAALSLLAAGVGLGDLTAKWNIPVLTDDLITGCILPFTAGGFIYIAMTSVLPDLLSSESGTESGGKRATSHWFRRLAQSLAEVVALVTGIAMMAALGLFEQ